MKHIVSVSLGSSKRDHVFETEILGTRVRFERRGTDGDMQAAEALIRELDGHVDAFGLGGIDLWVHAGGRRYAFRDARRFALAARRTPIVDGSSLKHTLERRVVEWMDREVLPLRGRRVLLVSSVDRFGMAEGMEALGADVTHGDLMFGLGVPIGLRSLRSLTLVARAMLPVVTRLPFAWLYPTGEAQERRDVRFAAAFEAAEVIAGDFHYIQRHMPDHLPGRTVLTNTVTPADLDALRDRGIRTLVTTTPDLGGRSFGTNLLEALVVALSGRRPDDLTPADHAAWLDRMGLPPRVVHLHG